MTELKIIDYSLRTDGCIIVSTNYEDIPVWVYPADKFKDAKGLKAEIKKKIKEIEGRKKKKDDKMLAFLDDVEIEIDKDAVMFEDPDPNITPEKVK